MYFHAFRRRLSIEIMKNKDEKNGVEDRNSKPRRSPRQATANNHVLASAPKNCSKWNVREGWVKIVEIHINRFVAAPVVQRSLVRSIPVIREHSIVHHTMCYMFIMPYQEALQMKLNIRAPRQLNIN